MVMEHLTSSLKIKKTAEEKIKTVVEKMKTRRR